jgi:hypothetical protein
MSARAKSDQIVEFVTGFDNQTSNGAIGDAFGGNRDRSQVQTGVSLAAYSITLFGKRRRFPISPIIRAPSFLRGHKKSSLYPRRIACVNGLATS